MIRRSLNILKDAAVPSVHTNHIRHAGTKFEHSKNVSPTISQPNKRETTFSGITHWIPNIWNTTLQNSWANSRWSKRWSTDSSKHLHIQCRLARKKPLLTSLSNMRIWPHAAVHRKKDTPLGGLNMLNALLRERNSEGATNRIIIGADIKSTTP